LARKRHQHRNKSKRFDCIAPNQMRTSSIVNVHVKHKASYGRHMFNANLQLAKVSNNNSELIDCFYRHIDHATEAQPQPIPQPLPKPNKDYFGTVDYNGKSQPKYVSRSNQTTNKPISKPRQTVKVCEHCQNIRLKPRKRFYRIVCDHAPLTTK
jgi:hypothetical protein